MKTWMARTIRHRIFLGHVFGWWSQPILGNVHLKLKPGTLMPAKATIG